MYVFIILIFEELKFLETTQKMKFSLRISLINAHLMKKSLMETFIFCAVSAFFFGIMYKMFGPVSIVFLFGNCLDGRKK